MTEKLVVVDADVLGRQRTGDETYVANLLAELPAAAADLRFAAVTRRPELVPRGVDAVQLPARSQIVRMAIGLPRLLRRLRPRLAHFQYVIPPAYNGPAVVTVHDLSFARHPELMGPRDQLIFRTLVPRSVRRAARVLTVSEWTRRDLIEHYRIDESKVVVTPNGVDPAFAPDGRSPDGSPYALFVGALHARKDPVAAVAALQHLEADLRLIVVGPDKGAGANVRRAVAERGLDPRVELRGHVPKAELAALYRGAACVVFPSRYEGFGLPVVEAMASGTPVVATAAGAVPEVAGDAAVLVGPGDPAALADGIRRALAERERLVVAGLERARLFTWAETAKRTAAVYRELV